MKRMMWEYKKAAQRWSEIKKKKERINIENKLKQRDP